MALTRNDPGGSTNQPTNHLISGHACSPSLAPFRGIDLDQRIAPIRDVLQSALAKGPGAGGLSNAEFEAGARAFFKEQAHGLADDMPKVSFVPFMFLWGFVLFALPGGSGMRMFPH